MLQLKLLPGAMLLMLASMLSTNPVSAQTDPASGTGGMQNQMDMNTPQTPSRTNTQPVPTPMQMENQSTPDSNQMQMQQSTPSSTETTTGMVSGTIRSIEGETVTIEMADGMTKQMMVSRADLQRLNLREGMQISATLDTSSMASNITVAQASTTTTGTEATSSQVGRTSTSTESTTSTITTEPDVSSDPTRTTTESTSTTVQSTPANRPVRALW
ncbi:hypothetical protein [Chlorogloea sp. CCALA 695]|uniref:hypothetical protein n=1 Tax=Chlorogloea sp. CCALA 695 TaxID=2107693 RepID=UPI000D425B02|nr:hypothetical protein [Chlorogloea sp. CCALA 695]PSB33830.1 hypothetical protein C7B70_05915 [Chlorogloea sp. CCALA 695]